MEELDLRKKVTIMIAVLGSVLFVALNQTIVGTALPMIIADIGGMHYFNWVFTIYMLASSITAILVGKMSDIYGRKWFILIGLGIFTLGSFLNGISGTIFQLIAYRAIQGFGAGIIMSTSASAIGDLFSPRERGRWQGLMGACFGVASVFGPTLGGYIVDHFDWHWVFWIFLPFGIISFSLILKLFPVTEQGEKEPVDYLGAILFACMVVPTLLAFSWAGVDYAWTSPLIISLIVSSIIALMLFVYVERRVASPILPPPLFTNNVFTISNVATFMKGVGMFGTIMYMPFFIQGVMGTSATKTGFIMMSLALSNVVGSMVSGQIITKTGKYKILGMLGLLLMAFGLVAAAFLHAQVKPWVVLMDILIVGYGLGTCFPVFTLSVQNSVPQSLLGVATASNQLFRQMGGTMGVAVLGLVLNVLMVSKVREITIASGAQDPSLQEKLSDLQDPQVLMDKERLTMMREGLPEQMLDSFAQLIGELREALSYALNGVFWVAAGIMIIGFIVTFFMKEIPLRTSNK